MSKSKSLKPLKLVVGILLLPCCVAITITFLHQLGVMGRGGGLLRDWRFLCLALGFILWLVIYMVMAPPTRVYVFAHEATHVVWGWVMGARMRNFKARKHSGSVTLSKTNFLITLAPYFFPFYCMVAIAVYLLGDFVFDWQKQFPLLCIAIGLGWGFHVTYTVETLSHKQTDVTSNGWLFSMAIIYWINFLVLSLLLTSVATHGSVKVFFRFLWRDHVDVWRWLVRALGVVLGLG